MTNKLIPCSDFVLEHPATTDYEWQLSNYLHYANFLKLPLTLSMFVPCSETGQILSEPDMQCLRSGTCQCGEEQVSDCRDWKYEYRKAKEKVLFEGFELIDNELVFNGDTYWTNPYETMHAIIEDLSHRSEIDLTPAAIKMIYGRDN